jgi:hypothetical protein
MGLPLSLHAAVTIMVKERLVASIPFFNFLGSGSVAVAVRLQRRQRQHSGGGQLCDGGGSLAEV